ncbi:phage tail protein [Vibrio splendidus]
MSQTAIPLEFEQYLQNKISLGEPTDLNEIIFAMIPNLDLSKPIDRTVGLPPLELWVYQQDVDQVGKSGINSVVYSVVIQGSQEPFTFNAMFLRDKNVPDSCGMVVYKATETKEVSMALTKSMLMQFDGAASAANVTVDAATWQIDYQARLGGMDEEHRLACLDNYGHTAFVDGFDVTRHDVDQNKYLVAPGVVYVGGLRIQNALVVAHNVTQKPTTLWLDVHRDGTALSTHENQFKVVASSSDLVDYVDDDGLQHYVCKLAGVEADGSVVDLRVKGGLDEHEMLSQFLPYNPERTYTTGEICYTKDQSTGELSYWEWYSNVESLAGKDPLDTLNRQSGWLDDTKPFYWSPYKKARTGTPLFPWMSMTFPEGTLNVLGNSVPIDVFWRLAAVLPEFVNVDTGMIDFPETGGEFFRVLDQARGVDLSRTVGSYQADLVKEHGHVMDYQNITVASGAGVTVSRFVSSGDISRATSFVGGVETRSRNLAFPILVEV